MDRVSGYLKERNIFNTFLTGLHETGLESISSDIYPFTLFIPTDEAFTKLPPKQLESLLNNPQELYQLLAYHIVMGRVISKDIFLMATVMTMSSDLLLIELQEKNMILNGSSKVIQKDIICANSVIHVIDEVLVP